MPYVKRNGVHLYHEVSGKGPALVFTHGNMQNGDHWRLQVPIFNREYKVIIHDLRGLGRSDKPNVEKYSVEDHTADLNSILKKLKVKKLVICGVSLGGNIAMQYYIEHPDEVLGLILVSTFATGEDVAIRPDEMKKAYDSMQGRENIWLHVAFAEKFGKFNPYAAEIMKWAGQEACKPPLYAMYAIARGFFEFDVREMLSKIKVPCLVIAGSEDIAVPAKAQKRLKEGLPNARMEIIKDAGHIPNEEKPEVFNEMVWNFIQEIIPK